MELAIRYSLFAPAALTTLPTASTRGRTAAPAQPLLPDRSEHGMELLQYVPQADRCHWQMRSKHSARFRIQYSDGDIVDHFQRLGYAVTCDDLAFTTEEVDDFVRARLTSWQRPGN